MTTNVRTDRSGGSDEATAAVAAEPALQPRRRPGTAGPKRVTTPPSKAARPDRPSATAATAAEADVATKPSRDMTTKRLPERSPGGVARLPWILAVLGLVGTFAFGAAWLSARGGSDGAPSATAEARSVKASAQRFSLALTNFDGATIDRDFDRLVALSTGDFQDQADQFFSAKTRKALKEAQASSRGEIRSAFVQSQSGDRASVFVVVDQTIANNKSPQPRADTLRMELSMRRSDGAWRVATVNVLQAPAEALGAGSAGTDAGN